MAKAQAQEPSMEEILASIRRIIADEDKAPQAAPPPPPPAAAVAKPAPPPPPPPPPLPAADQAMTQDDLDRLFGGGDDDVADEDAPAATAPDEDEADDVFELTEDAVAEPDLSLIEGGSDDLAFAEAMAEPEPEPEPVRPPPPARSAPPRPAAPMPAAAAVRAERLISHEAGSAVAAAFGNLSTLVTHRGGHTLEELVQDMMRPMLKEWLDDNLPPLVERLVRAEIERVVRGG
jgi:cell pole-organizing protein PopZ